MTGRKKSRLSLMKRPRFKQNAKKSRPKLKQRKIQRTRLDKFKE
jgi:hypothetical protein